VVSHVVGATGFHEYVVTAAFLERFLWTTRLSLELAPIWSLLVQSRQRFYLKDHQNGKIKPPFDERLDVTKEETIDKMSPHARLYRRIYPFLVEVKARLVLREFAHAIINAKKQEDFLNDDEHFRMYEIIFSEMLRNNLILSTPPEPEYRRFDLIHCFVPCASETALMYFLHFLTELSESVKERHGVSQEVERYVEKACYQTQIRLLHSTFVMTAFVPHNLKHFVKQETLVGDPLENWFKSFHKQGNPLPPSWGALSFYSCDISELLDPIEPEPTTIDDTSLSNILHTNVVAKNHSRVRWKDGLTAVRVRLVVFVK